MSSRNRSPPRISGKIVFADKLMTMRPSRAAIVPYYIVGDSVSFVFAVDSKYGDITDLGGGVRKYESAVTGAVREFVEESLGAFGDISIHHIANQIGVIGGKMTVIFVKYDHHEVEHAIVKFKDAFSNSENGGEISDLIILSEKEVIGLSSGSGRCRGRPMWSRIRRFYEGVNMIRVISILKILNFQMNSQRSL